LNLREVLKNDTCGPEWNFDILFGGLHPVEDLFDVVLLDGKIVAITDGGFEKDADRVGQLVDAGVAEGGELVKVMLLASVFECGFDALVERVGLSRGGESTSGGSGGEFAGFIEDALHFLGDYLK
jgi:hypothetical protein